MKTSIKAFILILICIIAFMISLGMGSVDIPIEEIVSILGNKLFRLPLPDDIQGTTISILWDIRLPRSSMAFIIGASLAVSGTVMQSILRNPLASSYTLGVSSGASLGAALFIVLGMTLPFLGVFALPLIGFLGGLVTVLLVMSFTARLDKNLENQTIILVGMVFSLFVNALLTLITALSRQYLEQLIFWQMGSFSGRNWSQVIVALVVTALCILFLTSYSREMDIMTFGESQALSVGVELKKVKFLLIGICALLTGTAVSFVGVIGFVDLIAPHVIRKLFGSSHKIVLPMAALFGGGFMVIADLIGRTILAPSELPVGAVTALIGAPFFAYIYFQRRKGVN